MQSFLNLLAKQTVVSILGAAGMYPSRSTARDRIASLISQLHPVTTDQELIRLGSDGDGGYLIPDDLAGVSICFSPGVGSLVGFERDCAARGMSVFMADASVSSPVQGEQALAFTPKFIGAKTSDEYITMDEWVSASGAGTGEEMLLQMDIEGGEYESILSMSDLLLRRFRIMAIEFHSLDQLWSAPFFGIAGRAFEKILQSHACVHIHPNNCRRPVRKAGISIPPVMEFTFLRRDRLRGAGYATTFPHLLDMANEAGADFPLPAAWYRRS